VKDRDAAKTLLAVFENCSRDIKADESVYIKCFSHKEELCYLFEYHEQRKLNTFVWGQITSPNIREEICINIVLSCLSSSLPFPLLYLILSQGLINIEKDNSVFFTPYFDLSELDLNMSEADCTVRCVYILLEILQGNSQKNLKSFDLLRKKTDSRSYRHFTELYRDIRITALPTVKPKLFKRFRLLWQRNKDTIFKILLVLSVVSAIIALVMLLSYLIFGDFILARLFSGSIDQIGTEQINIQ
jgi:hypothetical protein